MNYSVTTKAGVTHTVNSDLTDEQAKDVLYKKDSVSSFESTLIHSKRLSPKMASWLHVLAQWTLSPKPETQGSTIDLSPVYALMQHARDAGKKYPKIRLKIDGEPLMLAMNGKGKINITDGRPYGQNVWYGAIQEDGSFRANRATNMVVETLQLLALDPIKVAHQHGVATDTCCFCNISLSTKESRSVGYGPVCAENHGLPWGEIDAELEKRGEEILAV